MKSEREEQEGIIITPGSKLRIKSLESRDNPLITHGTFIGYTAIAHDEGMCIKLDKSHKEHTGQVRIIPLHVIVSIDIIEAADSDDLDVPDSGTMFG